MKKETSELTPFELAKDLIESDVRHGRTIREIMAGQHGMGGPDYHASVGGWIFKKGDKVASESIPSSKIVIETAQGKKVDVIFSLTKIYNIVKNELTQQSLI